MPASRKKIDACVDASLWVRLLAKEDQSLETDRLFELWLDEFNFFIAPSFLIFEIASAIRKKQKLELLGSVSIEKTITSLYEMPILLYQSEELLEKTMEAARVLGETSVYDASYLALATWKKVPFFTCDEKFYRKAKTLYADTRLV